MLPAPAWKLVVVALPDPEMVSIASNLTAFREGLLPFAKTAHEARSDAQLAAAGVYFAAAVEQIGLPLLSAAIKSGPVSALQAKLQTRLPLPDELRVEYWRTLGVQPKGTQTLSAVSSPSSRMDRFDRADFMDRPIRSAARPPVRADVSLPQPRLAQSEITRAYLHTLGWEGAEVDRLLAGPKGQKDA